MDLSSVVVALDLLAFAGAIAMTIQAWKAHHALGSKQSAAFLTCFALVAIGLFSRMLTDVLVSFGVPYIDFIEGLGTLIGQQKFFLLLSALCILTAFTLLLLVVEKIKERSLWVLVFVLVLFTIFLASNIYLISHIVAILLLGLLANRFWMNYLSKNSTNALVVYFAFLSLTAAHIVALLVPFGGDVPHVVFLALRIIGYFLLFAVSWRVTHG